MTFPLCHLDYLGNVLSQAWYLGVKAALLGSHLAAPFGMELLIVFEN